MGQLDAATERDIRALEDGFQKAMLGADVAWFEANWAPEALYVHTGGQVDERDAFVRLLTSKEHVHKRREAGDLRLRRYGDAVVATGWQSSDILNRGTMTVYESRFTRVYVKQGGRWICVSSQSGQNRKPA